MINFKKEIEAYKEANIKVYIITKKDYFYGGEILDIKEDYFILDDRKEGRIPITYDVIFKLTKLREKL